MKSLILIIICTLLLTNCGFKSIYSFKNSNFEIVDILNKNENKILFQLKKWLCRFQIKMLREKLN